MWIYCIILLPFLIFPFIIPNNKTNNLFVTESNLSFNRLSEWQEDSGEIREKEHLPVKAVRFGDTGTPLDEKQGRYILGPLMCEGDDLFNNVVTFRVTDATINLPPFDMGHSGDVYFEFKTTIENAVLFHAKVRSHNLN